MDVLYQYPGSSYDEYMARIASQLTEYDFIVSGYEKSIERMKDYVASIIPEMENVRLRMGNVAYDVALQKKTSYTLSIVGTLNEHTKGQLVKKDVTILRLPRMVGSFKGSGAEYSGDQGIPQIHQGFFVYAGNTYCLNLWETLTKNKFITIKGKDGVTTSMTCLNYTTYQTCSTILSYKNGELLLSLGRKMKFTEKKVSEVNFLGFIIFFIVVNQLYFFLRDGQNYAGFANYITSKIQSGKQVYMSITEIYEYITSLKKNPFSDTKKYIFDSFQIPELILSLKSKFYQNDTTNFYIDKSDATGKISTGKGDKPLTDIIDEVAVKMDFNLHDEKYYEPTAERIKMLLDHYYISLVNSFFCHVNVYDDPTYYKANMEEKMRLIYEMLYRFSVPILDSRDKIQSKSFDTAGMMIEKTVIKAMANKKFEKNMMILADEIEKLLIKNFKTGNWSTSFTEISGMKIKTGVNEIVEPFSFLAIQHFGKIVVSKPKHGVTGSGKNIDISHPPFIAGHETPEGKDVGNVKTLAVHTHITSHQETDDVVTELKELISLLYPDNKLPLGEKCYIVINDSYYRDLILNKDALTLVEGLRKSRLAGKINPFTSITYVSEEKIKKIEIKSTAGRATVPFLVIENNRILAEEYIQENYNNAKLEDLVEKGYVVFIDGLEIENYSGKILDSPSKELKSKYKFCLLDPSFYLSLSLAIGSKFPGNDATQRLLYFSQLYKAAANLFVPKQGIKTKSDIAFVKRNENPIIQNIITAPGAGINAVVASMVLNENTEDAILISEETAKNKVNVISFDHIDAKINIKLKEVMFNGVMTKLEELIKRYGFNKYGILPEGEKVYKGKPLYIAVDDKNEAVIRKYMEKRDGIINQILNYGFSGGYNLFVIEIMRTSDQVNSGDKFTTSHGQKGVISRVIPQKDVFYDPLSGQRIEMVNNSAGFITRLTAGQLKEATISRAFPCGRFHTVRELIEMMELNKIQDFYMPLVVIDPAYIKYNRQTENVMRKYGLIKDTSKPIFKDLNITRLSFADDNIEAEYVLFSTFTDAQKRVIQRKYMDYELPHALIYSKTMSDSLTRLRITGFKDTDEIQREALEVLRRKGYPNGETRLINPSTGRYIDSPIFVGVVYYYPLKQVSENQLRVAENAPLDPKTGEFVKGSKKHGAAKLGNMETFVFMVAKLNKFMAEKIKTEKVRSSLLICTKCKTFQYINKDGICSCGNVESVRKEVPPYNIRFVSFFVTAMVEISYLRAISGTQQIDV